VSLTIQIDKQPNASVVTLDGRLDVLTSDQLSQKILEAISEGAPNLLVDLGGLEYVSSSGLRVFLQARKALKPKGGQVVLCRVSKFVSEVLTAVGFDAIFPIAASVSEGAKKLPEA